MSTDEKASNLGGALLRVRDLSKRYRLRARGWRRASQLIAANKVSFEIAPGKTLALVGASGSGKSTVARCVARLEKPDAGEIQINGRGVVALDAADLFKLRAEVQMVFQDPVTTMNPRMSAAEAIAEPLVIQRRGTREERGERVKELLREVGVNPEWAERNITQFSGGQRQRIAIARALTLRPRLLILDEAFTGLDLSTQAQIANLLMELQAAHGLTYLLISHDLRLVSRLADVVAVMSAGEIVERGPAEKIMREPAHAETRALVAAGVVPRTGTAGGRS